MKGLDHSTGRIITKMDLLNGSNHKDTKDSILPIAGIMVCKVLHNVIPKTIINAEMTVKIARQFPFIEVIVGGRKSR